MLTIGNKTKYQFRPTTLLVKFTLHNVLFYFRTECYETIMHASSLKTKDRIDIEPKVYLELIFG